MVKINERYFLGSNKNTFILYEKKTSSSGKESYKNIGYLSSLDAVYNSILEKEIKEDLSILNNIKEINKLIDELKEFTIKYISENDKRD